MNTFNALAIALTVLFTFGPAYAIDDQAPEFINPDLITPGSVIEPTVANTIDWSARVSMEGDPRFSLPDDDAIPPLNAANDAGSLLYADDLRDSDTELAGRSARGSAAGGMAEVDELTNIWDDLPGVDGGSDLPYHVTEK
jgi:hypothetical protein